MDARMVESSVEFLFGLCLSALILMVGACILGSIVAALRAVNHESDGEREEAKRSSLLRLKRLCWMIG
jgi:hypothetical protein